MPAYLLALSSSGPVASAALLQDGVLLGCLRGPRERPHAETLMPLVEELLAGASLSPRDIDAYAADLGPGSFTGVRIGVCALNAMAAACAKPALGVSSLHALAYGRPGLVCALLNARNSNAYAAIFQDGVCVLEPQAVEAEVFLRTLPGPASFVGDGAEAYYDLIDRLVCKWSYDREAEVCADAVALAAWPQFLAGHAQEALTPLYLRPSQAERLFQERRQ